MENLLIKIRDAFGGLNSRDQKIASFILENQNESLQFSIQQIALRCETSEAAVVRFCKQLGLEGFKDFKRRLASDMISLSKSEETDLPRVSCDLTGKESISDIIQMVVSNNTRSITDTQMLLEETTLRKAVELIHNAPKVDFYGVGASGLVAMDAEKKLIRLGKNCQACTDPHMQITLAANLSPQDVAVFVSFSGVTTDILKTAEAVKKTGASIIALTKYTNHNILAQQADVAVYITSPELKLWGGSLSSRIALLSVVDILFLGVTSMDPERYYKKLGMSYEFATKKRLW